MKVTVFSMNIIPGKEVELPEGAVIIGITEATELGMTLQVKIWYVISEEQQ